MTAQEFLNRLEILGECPGRTAAVVFLPLSPVQAQQISDCLLASKLPMVLHGCIATAQDVKEFVDSVKKLQRPEFPI